MTRLKSLTSHPPNGFQILLPEIGMDKQFSGSFTACCDFFRGVIRANAYLAKKNGWSDDEAFIKRFVEAQNVARLIAHGWTTFLIVDGADESSVRAAQVMRAEKKTSWPGALLAGVKSHVPKAAAGIGVVVSWLGEGLEPVTQELAEKRGWTCAVRADGKGCPKNSASIACQEARAAKGETGNPLDWFQQVAANVAEAARTIMAVMLDLKLETSHDSKLGSCLACDCNLKVKLWPPLEHTLKNTSPEVMADLDEQCWILREKKDLPVT